MARATNKETTKIRIIAVYRMILEGKKISAGEIQRRLLDQYGIDVERKTIYTDVAAIDRFIPIEVTTGRNGGYAKWDVLGGGQKMARCDSYHRHGNTYRCYGTKAMEECTCGGNQSKCNFYPEKREQKTQKMANEKRLIPCGEKCTLDELPCGTIFAFGDDCIAVKSEYRCNNGLIEAFIIDSGEQFWGGVHTAEEQNALMVQPLEIKEVDAVEVVHSRAVLAEATNIVCTHKCAKCDALIVFNDNYCPNCGAMMDGGNEDV